MTRMILLTSVSILTGLPIANPALAAAPEAAGKRGPVGWASVPGDGVESTTGGGDVPPQRVDNPADLRRLARGDSPAVIEISGIVDAGDSPIDIGSNKTIVGADAAATLRGGFHIGGRTNVILSNLIIQGRGEGNEPPDAVAARGSHHLWFDHLDLRDGADGNLDLTRGCNYMTVSWCRFRYSDAENDHRLTSLVGGGSTHGATDRNRNNVTFHHNWFSELVRSRMPRILFGKAHIFNNYYSSKGNQYCIGAGSFAAVLVENNYFRNVEDPHRFQDSRPAFITARGNVYDNVTGRRETGLGNGGKEGDGAQVVPFLKPPYPYTPDEAKSVPAVVTAGAGPRDRSASPPESP